MIDRYIHFYNRERIQLKTERGAACATPPLKSSYFPTLVPFVLSAQSLGRFSFGPAWQWRTDTMFEVRRSYGRRRVEKRQVNSSVFHRMTSAFTGEQWRRMFSVRRLSFLSVVFSVSDYLYVLYESDGLDLLMPLTFAGSKPYRVVSRRTFLPKALDQYLYFNGDDHPDSALAWNVHGSNA